MKHTITFPLLGKINPIFIRFFTASLFLFYTTTKVSSQEPILSNPELFKAANKAIENKKYRQAEVYLYAFIQRNSEQYKTDERLRNELNAVLKKVRNNDDPRPGVGANYDQGAFLGYSYELLVASSNSNTFIAGTYKDNFGVIYVVNKTGNQVWWTSSNGRSHPTIMHGKIIGNYIFAEWSFTPGLKLTERGMIKFKITNSRTLTVETSTGSALYHGSVFKLQ